MNSTKSNNNVQNMFFGKETITGLHKILLQQTNMENASKDMKQELVNTLVKNMKTVYKSIDSSKINNTNFNSIFDQFKKHSVMESINEFKSPKQEDIKFKRDFGSNPNSGNKLLDRPQSTKMTQPRENSMSNSSFEGFSSNSGSYESSLDQAFRPIVENPDELNKFNNYTVGRGKDTSSRMEDVQKTRQNEVMGRNQRPPTPDFLKTQKTNPEKDMNMVRNMPQQNQNKGDRPDFTKANSSDMNQGFQGLANDMGDDLYSLDNIDKPLIDMEMVEDTANFEDRLKKLQSERGTLKPTTNNNGTIDFTSDNFPKSSMGDNTFQREQRQPTQVAMTRQMQQQPTQVAIQQQQLQPTQVAMQQQQLQQQPTQVAIQQQLQQQQLQQQQLQQQQLQQQQLQQQQLQQQQLQQQPTQTSIQSQKNDKFAMLKDSMKSVNINPNSNMIQLKQTIERLEEENKILQNELISLREDKSLEKLEEIKEQIANEFEELRNKNEIIESKESIINMKEIDLAKKEADVKMLITNYDYLFKSKQLQFEVTNTDNKSNYTWNMNNIPNVMGIKLMSYSLPLPRYNIHMNKNNMLKFMINNTEHIVEIKSGRYNIDDLVSILNQKISSMTLDITISINMEQHIVIESEKEFTLVSTSLLKDNLGFIKTNDMTNRYVSDRVWDLRIDDKVYLYLTNLSEDIPFGILYFNSMSSCQFKFDKPYNMNTLQVVFKDSMGYDYNFHNLPHSLSFLVDRID